MWKISLELSISDKALELYISPFRWRLLLAGCIGYTNTSKFRATAKKMANKIRRYFCRTLCRYMYSRVKRDCMQWTHGVAADVSLTSLLRRSRSRHPMNFCTRRTYDQQPYEPMLLR